MDHCPISNKPCPHAKNINFSQLVDGEVENLNICQLCMIHKDHPLMPTKLTKLMDMIENVYEKKRNICSCCGMRFEDIIRAKRYGCDNCYKTFREQSISIFKKCQFENKHIGKVPSAWEKEFLKHNASIQIALLKEEMQIAVSHEKYEEAAAIQDKIKEIEATKDKP